MWSLFLCPAVVAISFMIAAMAGLIFLFCDSSAQRQDGEVTAFSEKLWCGLLDYATAYADGRLTFTFKNGSTFEG